MTTDADRLRALEIFNRGHKKNVVPAGHVMFAFTLEQIETILAALAGRKQTIQTPDGEEIEYTSELQQAIGNGGILGNVCRQQSGPPEQQRQPQSVLHGVTYSDGTFVSANLINRAQQQNSGEQAKAGLGRNNQQATALQSAQKQNSECNHVYVKMDMLFDSGLVEGKPICMECGKHNSGGSYGSGASPSEGMEPSSNAGSPESRPNAVLETIEGLEEAIKQAEEFASAVDEEGLDRDGLHIAIYTVLKAAKLQLKRQRGE